MRRHREPVLGYRNKTEAVFGLHAKGLTTPQIAKAIGGNTSKAIVKALLWHAKRRKAERYRMATIEIPEATLAPLRPHAQRRGLEAETLAIRLIAQCIEGDLVDAVLDDDGGENG